jgi:hypothetical protein
VTFAELAHARLQKLETFGGHIIDVIGQRSLWKLPCDEVVVALLDESPAHDQFFIPAI